MNRVILLGNLGADAELRVLNNGDSVLNFRLATSESWKDKETGEKKEKVEWHSCALFGKRAEGLAAHLLKGTKLLVEGSIETRSYEKDGEKRYATSIKVRDVEFAGGAKGGGAKANPTTEPDDFGASQDGDDDLPF